MTAPRPFRPALVAHDAKKAEMADFVAAHGEAMRGFELFATGTTGTRILERCPALSVTRLKSGPLGGDQQIGALIAEGRVDALIFFVDPLSPHPHDVDVKALTRLGLVYDIPMALNRATGERLMRTLGEAPPRAPLSPTKPLGSGLRPAQGQAPARAENDGARRASSENVT